MIKWKPERNTHQCELEYDIDYYFSNKVKIKVLKYTSIDKNNPKTSVFRSIVALNRGKKSHITSKWWYIVHPMSFFCLVWESAMALVFFFQILSSPYVMAWRKDLFFVYSSDFLKVLCILNIVMTFFLGYINQNKEEVELNPKKIAWNYMCVKLHFFPEFIAAFPFTTTFIQNIPSKSLLNLFSWTCVFSLFYIYLLLQYSHNAMQYFDFSSNSYRIYRLILLSVFFFHWVACFHCSEYSLFSWKNDAYISEGRRANISDGNMYWSCLFQATSLTTRLGFRIEGVTNKRSVSSHLMTLILGVAFYFYILGELICLDYSPVYPKAKYDIQQKLVNEFMRQRKFPSHAQKRIKNFYEYKFQGKYFRESHILSSLSPRQREEILMYSCRHLLQKSLLFKNMPRNAISRLINCLKRDTFFPNDVIIKAGSYGDCMFFLARGTVAVTSRVGKEIVHLYDGAYFGELVLVLENEKRVTSVIAVEFCEVYRLDREDFKRILSPYRKIYSEITHLVVDRVSHSPVLGDPQQYMTI